MKSELLALSEFKYQGEIRDDLINEYQNNVTHFSRTINSILIPKSRTDLEIIIQWARRFKIALYPLSQGKNWGFGSRLPVQNNSVIVDLSKFNQIREINVEHGYAVIEAGVTQSDLAKRLEEIHVPFTLDVTGSGANTSIIGNALERGIAYHSLRVDRVYNFEVLLGNGQWIKTGFNISENSTLNHLYPHGIGPGLQHLFFQSNFGIVTSATVKLQPRSDDYLDFKFSFKNENLGNVFFELKKLRQRGMINSICRTGDFARSFETLAPLLLKEYQKLGFHPTLDDLKKSYRRFNKLEWVSFGRLTGTIADVKFKKREVENSLRPFGTIQFFSENSIEKLYKLSKFFKQWDLYCNLKSSSDLRKLTAGVPTDAALSMVSWNPEKPNEFSDPVDSTLDQLAQGFILVVPLCPLTKSNVEKLVSTTKMIVSTFAVNLGITLNIIDAELIEGVVSLKFSEDKQGFDCMKKLYEEYKLLGFYPYRLNPETMSSFVEPNQSFWKAAHLIKQSLDPDGIIAPGRYS